MVKAIDLYCRIKDLFARGTVIPGGFKIYKGSAAVLHERPAAATASPGLVALRRQLVQEKILIKNGDHYIFAVDYEVASVSKAASIVQGGNANGLTEWKTKDRITLKELQEPREKG